jgi:3-keto-L-gulonate-6-phosphate decarboxylase/chromosome segregation ATPase
MKPVLQVNLDTTDLDDAVKIADRASTIDGIVWLGIGKKLIKSSGLAAVKAIKSRFPDKYVVVDMDILGRSRQLRSVIDAGADILLISGKVPESTIKSFVDEFKRNGVRIMVDLTKTQSQVELAKKVDAMNVNYMLVDFEHLEEIASSVITAVAVNVDSDPRKISEALEYGAQILVLDKNAAGRGPEDLVIDVNKLMTERPARRTMDPPRVAADDEYMEKLAGRLDNIKKTLLTLESQRKTEEEHRLQIKKEMREMEERFKKMMEGERGKIEEEKENIKEQMGKINSGWKKLQTAESRLAERQKTLEKDNSEKWDAMLKDFEAEMLKRLEEHKDAGDVRLEEKGLSIESELEEIKKEWADMEKEWQKIDEDKKDIEDKRRDIESAWKKVETETREEPAEKRSAPCENDDALIQKELSEVEAEWKDIEDVWGRIDEDKKQMNEKRREIDAEWAKIEGIKADIEKDQELIEKQMKELEKMKSADASNLAKLVARVSEIKRMELEKLGAIYDEREDITRRQRGIDEAEKRIEAERNRVRDEIKRLEDEWYKIREVKGKLKDEHEIKKLKDEHEIKRIAKPAVVDLVKLKREHEKKDHEIPNAEKTGDEANAEDAKTRGMVNQLIDLVNEKGELKLKDAAKQLQVQEYLLRRLADLLEKRKIIEIAAPLLGDVVLRRGKNMKKLN